MRQLGVRVFCNSRPRELVRLPEYPTIGRS